MLSRLSFVAAALIALLVMAQMPMAGFPPGAFSNKAASDPVAVAAYQGPGDLGISGIYAFFSTQAYSAAASGTAAVNACLPNGGTCADFDTDVSTGKLDVTTIAGSSCTTPIVSGTYVTATGAVSLVLSSGIGIVSGNYFAVTVLTGTGSLTTLNGVFIATTGSTGTTLNYTGPTGLGTVTISGGTISGCTGAKWYDQSGANKCSSAPCNGTQATLAMQPVLVVNVLGGTACWGGNGTPGMGFQTGSMTSISLPMSMTGVAERTGNFTTAQRIIANNINPPYLDFRSAANSPATSASTQIQGTANDNTFHALIAALGTDANADSVLVSDGSVIAGPAATGTTTWGSTISLMTNPTTNNANIFGFECEASLYSVLLNSTQYGNINTNIHGAGRFNF